MDTSSLQPMWIAPSRYPKIKYWTVDHWKGLTFTTEAEWNTAIEIFEDRLKYRYLDAIKVLQDSDDEYFREQQQRRFGFSMMALDCLLIETLAQFREGLKDSDEAKTILGKNNAEFYIHFLTQASFELKKVFDLQTATSFYKTIRCGILHQAETKEDSRIRFFDNEKFSSTPFEPSRNGKSLKVFWSNFHILVEKEFNAYCTHLLANDVSDLREKFIAKMNNICHLSNGILAYGSLRTKPGNALKSVIQNLEPNVVTPFPVEYARRSQTRAGAPTLVRVPEEIGSHVNGAILILKPDADMKKVKDLLFRREKHRESDKSIEYNDKAQREKKDALIIETMYHFQGFGEIHYTVLKANFMEILDPCLSPKAKAELLALAAVDSVTVDTFKAGLDGIQYLSDNIKAGIETPLSKLYETAILEMADNAPNLNKARLFIAHKKGCIP